MPAQLESDKLALIKGRKTDGLSILPVCSANSPSLCFKFQRHQASNSQSIPRSCEVQASVLVAQGSKVFYIVASLKRPGHDDSTIANKLKTISPPHSRKCCLAGTAQDARLFLLWKSFAFPVCMNIIA